MRVKTFSFITAGPNNNQQKREVEVAKLLSENIVVDSKMQSATPEGFAITIIYETQKEWFIRHPRKLCDEWIEVLGLPKKILNKLNKNDNCWTVGRLCSTYPLSPLTKNDLVEVNAVLKSWGLQLRRENFL
jgi:hypothetical protein